jgi:hypothetical protein
VRLKRVAVGLVLEEHHLNGRGHFFCMRGAFFCTEKVGWGLVFGGVVISIFIGVLKMVL